MNTDEITAKEKAWKKYRADILARYIFSLTPAQQVLFAEYQRSGKELLRLRTWRKHKPNSKKQIPKVVPWPPEMEHD